eukprot:8829868-Alexandrium_andersonii.AAC.1
MKSRAGYISKGGREKRARPPREHKASAGDLKQQRSLVAAICNDADLREHLPQVFMPRTLGPQKLWVLFPKDWHRPSLRIILGNNGSANSKIWSMCLHELLTEVKHHRPLGGIAPVFDAYDAHLG